MSYPQAKNLHHVHHFTRFVAYFAATRLIASDGVAEYPQFGRSCVVLHFLALSRQLT
jgi:hypothetical protein